MKIFRVHKHDATHESQGYEYFSNLKEAEKCLKKHNKDYQTEFDKDDIEQKDVVIGKYEILRLLNHWGSHSDNG